jgi:hypothetical protein
VDSREIKGKKKVEKKYKYGLLFAGGMHLRSYLKSKVWSNASFAIPLAIALWHQLFFHAGLILLVCIFSSRYHLSDEKRFGALDRIFTHALIAYNLYLCFLSDFRQPYFSLAALFVLVGFYFFYVKKKDDYEWHMSSAIITLFCILAYVAP